MPTARLTDDEAAVERLKKALTVKRGRRLHEQAGLIARAFTNSGKVLHEHRLPKWFDGTDVGGLIADALYKAFDEGRKFEREKCQTGRASAS